MNLKRMLLVEDSANDIELILIALAENNLANEMVVVRDGEEALHYSCSRYRCDKFFEECELLARTPGSILIYLPHQSQKR